MLQMKSCSIKEEEDKIEKTAPDGEGKTVASKEMVQLYPIVDSRRTIKTG